MKKRWVLNKAADFEVVNNLAQALNVDHSIAMLLVQRGIYTYEDAREFFRPELSRLHDPYLMKDMDRAVERIGQALQKGEKILIYGDYDVDGTTAVALVYTFLRQFSDKIDYYIPDRYSEGYGISTRGIDYAADEGFSLVIALDCGIKATDKIMYAREKDIDFIIGDHHRPDDTLPPAVAVLDPKRDDCPYPYKELSGCGVAFKLVQAYCLRHGLPFNQLEKYLDLVVVSIAADIVPITGENRILAYYGLKLINSDPRPAFEAILKHCNVTRKVVDEDNPSNFIFTKELSISDLVFLIGPRINAAGRIESGRNSVDLLVSDDEMKASQLAGQINEFNTERRNLDLQATQHALEIIAADDMLKNKKTTVVYNPEWHQGVVGIVASRLTDTYYRPTIVLTKANGLITGSARSIKDFDIYDAVDACSDLLEHFGGHKYAAGLSLKPENLNAFIDKFEDYVSTHITEEMLMPEIEIDLKINLNDIHPKFYRILSQFAPFGPGNMKPVFLTNGLADTGYARIVGKNHIKMTVAHPEIRSFFYPAIAFQQGDFLPVIEKGVPFDICYHIEENDWNGNVSLQLNIKDIRINGQR
ncbi:MAG TPA: single-stranded-DNA-specific exonuclease RecJ [Bacteroidales bacterium]|nr:single-stranded-DNA-specific exonuclease RecJ [Bacteroidales bacterium]